MDILQIADEYKKNSLKLINRIDFKGQVFWIKRRPLSKKTRWHQFTSLLSYVIPIATFNPTVITDKSDSLIQEANRLRLLASKGLPVPQVLMATPNYLITHDVGDNLQQVLTKITDYKKRKSLLEKAMDLLIHLHQTNLCHGRPSLRDMTFKNEQIYLIDLEENPLEVMSLAQAQARDIWLFFCSLARHCKNDYLILDQLAQTYANQAPPATMAALKQMVLFLKPVRIVFESLLTAVKSKDLHNAIKANKALETLFSTRYFKDEIVPRKND